MKCPICGSIKFFVKDPADEFETYEFDLKDGQAVFPAEPQEVGPATETYCQRCAWHGRFESLK